MYVSLIEKNNEKANNYLKEYQKINKKQYTKNQLEEAEKLFKEIDKRKK